MYSGGTMAQGGLDMGTSDVAYQSLVGQQLVVAGQPQTSPLYIRLDPSLCAANHVTCMPKGGTALTDMALGVVRAWIEMGAAGPGQ
jgi:hypothetical protein